MTKSSNRTLALTILLILTSAWLAACGTDRPSDEATLQPPPTTVEATATAGAPTAEPTEPQPTATEPRPTATTASPTDSPTPTLPPATETPPAASGVDEVVASLRGLSLDEFFEESYRQLILRDPQHLTEIGLAAEFGLRNDRLTNLSDAYVRETQELEVAILDLLRTYDRDALTADQQVSYDVYEWYLDNQVRGHQFMYHDYPLHHFLRSYHFELDALFNEIHPLENLQEAEDFIARLSQVDGQVEQLMEGLKIREETGVIPPRYIVTLAKQDMMRYLQMRSPDPASIKAQALPFYLRFDEALEGMGSLSAGERQQLRAEALAAIKASFIPAYLRLIDYVDTLLPATTDDAGVWKLPDGDAYYAYLLRQETSTDLTPAQIHEIGLAEVDRIRAEMRQIFAELGYLEDASFQSLMDRAMQEAGFFDIGTQAGKDRYVAAVEATIQEVDERVSGIFNLRPQGEVVVIGGPWGGYYVPGTADGSRPGAYHVSLGGQWRPKYSMQTIAYHEAIPGHHFQIATAQEMDLPLFRNDIVFNAYAEGWAMYGERLGWELGLYDDNPYGNLGRLQFELLRAVRLVTDTGLHAMGWTREEAKAYMDEAMGSAPGQFSHEVDRYTVLPAQATGYKIGLIKILELRQRAMDQLGEQFDVKEFHDVVLGNGSVPLDILEQVVQDYIDAKLSATS